MRCPLQPHAMISLQKAVSKIEINQDLAPSDDGTSFSLPTGFPSIRRQTVGLFGRRNSKTLRFYTYGRFTPTQIKIQRGVALANPSWMTRSFQKQGWGARKSKPQLKPSKIPEWQLISILWQFICVPSSFFILRDTEPCLDTHSTCSKAVSL